MNQNSIKSLVLGVMLTALSPETWSANYKLDTSHTQVGFKIKHLVISTVSGRFNKFTGGFDFDPKSGDIKNLNVEIEAASIDTNEPDRDKHLKGADFFDIEKFPKLLFTSKKTITESGKPSKLEGELTIHGVKKIVTLDLEYKGSTTDPWGNERIAFEASSKVNRKDFGLKWNKNLDKGGIMIDDEVKIQIEGEAILQKEEVKKK